MNCPKCRASVEPTTVAQLCSGYVLPLSLLAALLAFLRTSVIGVTVPFSGVMRLPMTTGLEYLVLALISGLIGSFLVALIINGLAPTFGGQRDQRQAMLPSSVAGMKRTNIKGEGKAAVGVKTTSAVANYANDSGAGIELEIDDMSGVSSLMGLSNTLVESNTSQSDTGYEKNLTLGGRSAHETYDSRGKKGEINMLVANRFTVNVSGAGIDMPTLEQAYTEIDLDKLESLKNAGAVH